MNVYGRVTIGSWGEGVFTKLFTLERLRLVINAPETKVARLVRGCHNECSTAWVEG